MQNFANCLIIRAWCTFPIRQRAPELLLSPANLMELFVLINFYQIIGIMNAWERFMFSEKSFEHRKTSGAEMHNIYGFLLCYRELIKK